MNTGTVWIKKELSSAALAIIRGQVGVSQADVLENGHRGMVLIEYHYTILTMKMFIAHELDRKIKLLGA